MSFYQSLKSYEERIHNLQKQKQRIYRKGHVFDKTKSMIWNITMLNEENEKILQNNKNIQLQINYWEEELEKEMIKEVQNQTHLPKWVVQKIVDFVYEDRHSYGMQSVYEYSLDLAKFIDDLGVPFQ